MNREKQDKFALFVSNTQTIKKEFTWHDVLTKRLAALLYTIENKPVDCEAIRESHNLIKSNTGVFSSFRGNMSLCVAAMLSLKENRQETFANTLTIYDMLKKAKFHASDYLAVAAYQIAAHAEHDTVHTVQQTVNRAKEFYDGMKARRWFYTGQDDYIFAAMLGLSGTDVKTGVEDIERIYQQLKSEFWAKNSVQTLAQILVLCQESHEATERVLALRDALRKRNIRLDKTYTLPAMGILALLPVDTETIVQHMNDAKSFLREQKGFGAFSLTTQELLLLVASIIAAGYAEEYKNGVITASLSTSIAGIIIAQQTAIIIAAASSGAAAASSSSGGG